MIVVSNTSPIINLAAVSRLDLLQRLYGHIIVPEAVYREIVESGRGRPGAFEVQSLPWFEVRVVANRVELQQLLQDLDAGEAEAIVLALELHADLLLLDERRARAIAQRRGLTIVGLLGALVLAKRQGELAEVKPVIDSLQTTAGFRISQALRHRVLEESGEEPEDAP